MIRKILVSLSLGLLATTAAAQCGNLAVTGNGEPGTDVVLDLTGSTADAFTMLAVGDTAGTTTIELGRLGTLTLGIEMPFIPLPMGRNDAAGDNSLTISVPGTATMGIDLLGQAVAVDFGMGPMGPSLGFCTSNVAAFRLGPANS